MTDTDTTETVEAVTEDSITSLSDVFKDEPEVETAQAADTEDESQGEAEGEAKAEPVEAVKAEPAQSAESPSAEDIGFQAAYLAERDKRQKAERERDALQTQPAPAEVPDPIENPEGHAKYIDDKLASSELKSRIGMSKTMMMSIEPDFARLEQVFMGMVSDTDGNVTDESMVTQFQQAANPAQFMIDKAKDHEQAQTFKDPKYRENLKAELRSEILAEIAENAGKVSATNVPNLTKAPAAGLNSIQPEPENTIAGMFQQ